MNKNKFSLIWEKYEGDGSVERPSGREGHILVNLSDKNSYLLFSGISHTRYSDVYTFDISSKKWKLQTATGEIPKELCYAVGWYDSPFFFFHGGRNKESSLSDTYFLDCEKWIWRKVFTMEQPTSRFHHAAVKTEGKEVYIFGGCNIGRQNRLLGDLHRYEYKSIKIIATESDKVSGSSWINIADKGTKPSARRGHSMVYYQNSIILYGGETKTGIIDENFYKYSIDTWQWSIITISGVKPGFRCSHTMNFFKQDSLIIFGGKVRSSLDSTDLTVCNDIIYIDLNIFDCSTPFLANIGPSERFGHAASCNSNFQEPQQIIIGGLNDNFCSMDVYMIKEIELKEDKKWVYEQQKIHSSQKIDGSDEIFETAKKTIINYKKKIEELTKENICVNKKYSEYFQQLSKYHKSMLEEDISNNEKKSQLQLKKSDLAKDKREIFNKSKDLKDYNNFLNTQLKINREKFLILSEFLIDLMDDVKLMDEILCAIDKNPSKLLLFSEVNLDSLIVKRRYYQEELNKFQKYFQECSLYEKDLYDEIMKLQNEQKQKFKQFYMIVADERQTLSFREGEEVNNISNDSLEHSISNQ